MRGKALNFSHTVKKIGITPAYAGKRNVKGREAMRKKDHPRLCGEKQQLEYSTKLDKGSPPPMRGKAFSVIFLG